MTSTYLRSAYLCNLASVVIVSVLQEKETLGATDDPPYLAIGLGVGFGVFLIIAIFVILCIYRYHNKQIAEYRDVFYSQGSDYQVSWTKHTAFSAVRSTYILFSGH